MNAPKTTENQLELEVLSLRKANDRLRLKLKKCWEHSMRAAGLSDPFLTDDESLDLDDLDDGCSTEGLGLDDPDWDPEFKHEGGRWESTLVVRPDAGLDESYEKFRKEEAKWRDLASAHKQRNMHALTNTTKWPAGYTAFVVATGRECKVLETWPHEWWSSFRDCDAEDRPGLLNCYVEFSDVDFELDDDGSFDGVFTLDQLEILGAEPGPHCPCRGCARPPVPILRTKSAPGPAEVFAEATIKRVRQLRAAARARNKNERDLDRQLERQDHCDPSPCRGGYEACVGVCKFRDAM